MNYEHLQAGAKYMPPAGSYIQFKPKQTALEGYVIHYRHSYDILRAKLSSVQGPQLAYRLFYCLASDLEYPFGNTVDYNVKQLAHRFGVSSAAIYDALRKLFEADAARKIKLHVLQLDPHLVFAGDTDHLQRARDVWNTAHGLPGLPHTGVHTA